MYFNDYLQALPTAAPILMTLPLAGMPNLYFERRLLKRNVSGTEQTKAQGDYILPKYYFHKYQRQYKL